MTDAPPSEELITIPCADAAETGCDKTFTGKAKGPGSAIGKMSLHRANAHGYRNPRPQTKKQRERAEARDDNARPVLALVGGMADEVKPGKGAPSRDELQKALGRGLGVVSVAVASYAAETDPRPLSDAQRDDVVAYLAINQRAANDVMDPFAKALAGSKLNTKYGRGIVENVDTVAAAAELAKVMLHWRRYFKDREQWAQLHGGAPAPQPGVSPPQPPATGMAPEVQEAMSGEVWTPERVAMETGRGPAANGSIGLHPNAAAPA